MNNHGNSTTATMKTAVCAILFSIFIFVYTYFFQYDVLEMVQYAWSDGLTHYNRIVGSLVISITAIVITVATSKILRLPEAFETLAGYPAILCIALITSAEIGAEGNVAVPMAAYLKSALYTAAYALLLYITKQYATSFPGELLTNGKMNSLYNAFVFLAMVIMTYSIGNTDRTLHTRLAVERLCRQGLYEEALEKGMPQYDNDPSMPMLRALALAHTGELGEKLFTYNIEPTQENGLLPGQGKAKFLLNDTYIAWQTVRFVPRNQHEDAEKYLATVLKQHPTAMTAADYLLCTYLMRGELKDFVNAIPKYYDMHQRHLPEHYSEALVMYNHMTHGADSIVKSACAIMPAHTANYTDFLNVARSTKDPQLRDCLLRDAFFGTYWYYYYQYKKH